MVGMRSSCDAPACRFGGALSLWAAVRTCSRKEAELCERLKEWEAKGFRVTVFDLSVREQRARLISEVAGRFTGKLDILVDNVGTNIRKLTTEYSAEECSFFMATNLESAYHFSHLELKSTLLGVTMSVDGGMCVNGLFPGLIEAWLLVGFTKLRTEEQGLLGRSCMLLVVKETAICGPVGS